MESKSTSVVIAQQTLRRVPYYVRSLNAMKDRGLSHVSAPVLARELGLGEVQVRKDLAAISATGGKPKLGFEIDGLLKGMRDLMGAGNVDEAILVGVGSIGRALMGYKGFDEFGVHILAGFDANPNLVGQVIAGKPVYPMERLGTLCARLGVHIGIIAVPASEAQQVCDQLIESGILAVWNFAPVHLFAPEEILIQNENMASSLAILSKHLRERLE